MKNKMSLGERRKNISIRRQPKDSMATEGGTGSVVHEERSNTTEQATEQHAEQNAADAVKEKEEKPTEGKVEQKTRAGLTEIATPGHLPQETSHFFQCSSVKSVSVSWDENLRFRKSMEVHYTRMDLDVK